MMRKHYIKQLASGSKDKIYFYLMTEGFFFFFFLFQLDLEKGMMDCLYAKCKSHIYRNFVRIQNMRSDIRCGHGYLFVIML